jgi:hypothetical protein
MSAESDDPSSSSSDSSSEILWRPLNLATQSSSSSSSSQEVLTLVSCAESTDPNLRQKLQEKNFSRNIQTGKPCFSDCLTMRLVV